MADPRNCAPGDPRQEADLSDYANWDPVVSFTPDDASRPRMGGVPIDTGSDSDALAEQLALEAEFREQRKTFLSDKQPWYSAAVNWARVPQELFRSLETYTNVPFYAWFRRIEDARDDVDQAVTLPKKEIRELSMRLRPTEPGIFKTNREAKKQVQRLFEARLHDPVQARELADQMDPGVVVAADHLDGVYRRYFQSQDFTDDEITDFLKALGHIRERDGDYLGFKSDGRVPKIMSSMEEAFRTGEIMLDAREYDFQIIAETLIQSHARIKHLGPAWNIVRNQVEGFEAEGLVPPDLMKYMRQYLTEVRHVPDHWQIAMGRFMNKVNTQLFGGRLEGLASADLAHGFLSNNYYANMAWAPGVAIRNFMQPLITTYPVVGEKWMAASLQTALRAVRNPEKINEYARLGVITREAEPLAANAIRESMIRPGNVLSGPARDTFNWLRDHGWTMFRSAENLNRIWSYDAFTRRAKHYGEQFLEGKIGFQDFWERSRLDWMDGNGGPITNQIRTLLEGGDLEQAAHLMGLQGVRKTQFIYQRGNQPYVMQGSVARLLGQYGTWPAWYASYMSDMFFQGSLLNRGRQLARWTGANAAVMYGASEVFGVDMARWAFFSPLGYTGGPFTEVARSSLAAASSPGTVLKQLGMDGQGLESTDPVTRIQAGRFLNGYQQVVPFPFGAGRGFWDAYWAAQDDDWKTATKRFLGFQPSRDE